MISLLSCYHKSPSLFKHRLTALIECNDIEYL